MLSARWSALVFLLNSCATIPNTTQWSVAGKLDAGMIGAETQTDKTYEMSLEETIAFLEPKDGENPRAGAICMSSEDRLREKIFIEQACKLLGKRCKLEVPQALKTLVKGEAAQ